jgi:hypothetical protein
MTIRQSDESMGLTAEYLKKKIFLAGAIPGRVVVVIFS